MAESVFREHIRIEPVGFTEVTKAMEKIVPDLKTAITDTIRRSIPVAEETVVDLILKRYYISRDNLMNQTSRHGKWKAMPIYPTEQSLRGGVRFTGTRMPVMRFGVTPSTVPNQKGVRVADRPKVTIKVRKWGPRQSGAPNVFLARMPKTGHMGVYRRKYPNPGGPRKKRPDGQWTQLPITEEYMLSIPEMLQGKQLRKKFDAIFSKFVISAFKQELKKLDPKARRRIKATLKRI